ncbi:MAG: DegT/DnrJ/EryC1/StrS family aminotransferase [Verrucomicrobiia bacterium]
MKKNPKTSSLKLRSRPKMGLGAAFLGAEERRLVLDVLKRGELFRYYGLAADLNRPPPMAARFEKEFRAKMGTKHALGVTSGTAALEVALGALGVGPGDEVIVPAWSWISCFTSVVRVGGRPVLAEVDDTFNLDPAEITRLATPRTKAVIVVHYQGVAADMDPILSAAKKVGVAVLEDCAESPGALYHDRRVGSLGDIGIFSFQYQKSMTSGEGGAVVTNDDRLYERAVRMHDLGNYRPYHAALKPPTESPFCGSQFRMSELTAAVALAQLRKLDRIRNHCRRLRARIMKGIGGLPGLTFRRIPDPSGDSGFEIYAFLKSAELAVEFKNRLNARNVNCAKMTGTYPHYAQGYCTGARAHAASASPFAGITPWPAPGYRKEDFPRTEDLIHRHIALPLGVLYTTADADHVVCSVREVHAELRQ